MLQTAESLNGSLTVFLSSEFVHTDSDNVTSPFLMRGRHHIMKELVAKGYSASNAFEGWYFASEAYLVRISRFDRHFHS